MDALQDLGVGNVMNTPLAEIWSNAAMHKLRSSFGTAALNRTCTSCDMYRDLEFYRTAQGRQRAQLNLARSLGKILRSPQSQQPFSGG